MAAHEVYPARLSTLARGYAIWEPTPGIDAVTDKRKRAVRVGDVGYMYMGMFQILFNIHLEHDDPEQSTTLPEYFEPLPLDRRLAVSKHSRSQNVYKSSSVRSVGVVVGAQGPMLAGASASFSTARHQGAVLAVAGKINVENVLHKQNYEDYMLKNIDRWHALTVQHGMGLKMEEIILVTGRDLVRSWANAAFCSTDFEASVSLEAEIMTIAEIKLAVNVRFSNIDGADYGWGPDPDELVEYPTRTPTATPAISTNSDNDAFPQTNAVIPSGVTRSPSSFSDVYRSDMPPDQCVFLRRYRVKDRRFFGKKLMANAEARNMEDGEDGEGEGELGREVLVDCEPDPYHDPLEAVLDYILENSDANFAIAHDDDLVSFLKEIDDAWGMAQVLAHKRPAIVRKGPAGSILPNDEHSEVARSSGVKIPEQTDDQDLPPTARTNVTLARRWNLEARKILLIAGLFSVSITAFLVVRSTTQKDSEAVDTVEKMRQLPYQRSSMDFLSTSSLALGMACALGSMFILQWTRTYKQERPVDRDRDRRKSFLLSTGIPAAIYVMDFVLLIAVLLFFAGWIMPLRAFHFDVAVALVCVVGGIYVVVVPLPFTREEGGRPTVAGVVSGRLARMAVFLFRGILRNVLDVASPPVSDHRASERPRALSE